MAAAIDLEYPFVGRWLTQNSPANRVPSHGTPLFAESYAIDFVPVNDSGRTARITFGTFIRPEPPEKFPGFGRGILAPIEGTVLVAHDTEPDHPAYRGFPSIGYALTQRRRAAVGWTALSGNHVMLANDGVVIALCHLKQGSIQVRQGQHVHVGEVVAGCGNSGNSTEPHIHLQAMDNKDVERADAVPLTFQGSLPRNGEIVHAGEDRQPG